MMLKRTTHYIHVIFTKAASVPLIEIKYEPACTYIIIIMFSNNNTNYVVGEERAALFKIVATLTEKSIMEGYRRINKKWDLTLCLSSFLFLPSGQRLDRVQIVTFHLFVRCWMRNIKHVVCGPFFIFYFKFTFANMQPNKIKGAENKRRFPTIIIAKSGSKNAQ